MSLSFEITSRINTVARTWAKDQRSDPFAFARRRLFLTMLFNNGSRKQARDELIACEKELGLTKELNAAA